MDDKTLCKEHVEIECPDAEACIIYRQTFDATRQLIVILDNDLTINYVNLAIMEYLDMKHDEMIGKEYWNLPIWSHSAELQNKILFAMEEIYHSGNVKFETTHRDKTGAIRDIDFEIKAIFNENGQIKHLIAMGYDVTEIKETKSELKRKEEDLKTFFKYSVEGYLIRTLDESIYIDLDHIDEVFSYIMDHEKISDYNSALLKILKIDIDNIKSSSVMKTLFYDEREYYKLWKRTIVCGSADKEIRIDINGYRRILELNLIASIDANGKYSGVFAVIRDITERIELIEKMTYLATKDFLTGINNRRHYIDESSKIRNKYPNRDVYVAMMDIDNFKNVNDTYGHDTGDIVIRSLAKLIESELGFESIVGRMGGEEFAACVYKKDLDIEAELENIRSQTEKLIVKSDEHEINFTISIGYAKLDEKGDLEDALKKSDKALYKAKNSGKNRVEKN